jgi:hypothetical protein
MQKQTQTLILMSDQFAICRLDAQSSLPEWADQGSFFSITRTEEELSIVCPESQVPSDIQHESDWRCFKVEGPLDFSLVGVMASLTAPLAEADISAFVISTFDTDYVMVKDNVLADAIQAWRQNGHIVIV